MTTASVLVVDGDTALGTCLIRLYRDAGVPVAATCADIDSPDDSASADVLRVPWGPSSPVSARNVVLRCVNSFESLDTVIFPCAPEVRRTLLHETPLGELEAVVDRWIRGGLLLLREVLIRLARQGSGRLVLVHHAPRESPELAPPLEALVRSAFRGLASSLLASYEEKVDVVSVESSSPQVEEVAEFVHGLLMGLSGSRRRSFIHRPRTVLSGLLRFPFRRRSGTS